MYTGFRFKPHLPCSSSRLHHQNRTIKAAAFVGRKYNLCFAQIQPRHGAKEVIMKRIGVVGIVLRGDKAIAVEMQKVLSDFADIIIGRMGVPREEANAIALIVEGTQERISALTGKLGRFESLSVKSAITSFEIDK